MTLDEAVAAFEARFKRVRMGPPRAYFFGRKDGERVPRVFIVIRRGEKRHFSEDALFPLAKTPEEAVAQWFAVACAYATRAGGKRLVWRTKPEIAEHEGGWEVYSRLVVF